MLNVGRCRKQPVMNVHCKANDSLPVASLLIEIQIILSWDQDLASGIMHHVVSIEDNAVSGVTLQSSCPIALRSASIPPLGAEQSGAQGVRWAEHKTERLCLRRAVRTFITDVSVSKVKLPQAFIPQQPSQQ